MTDSELITNILARDRRALSYFYHTYSPKLTQFIRAKVDREEDCEEILQDTLYAFLEALRDFEGKASLRTFLYSICQHKVIDFYRRKKLKHIVFSQMPQLSSLISPLLNPEEELDVTLLKEKIRQVLSRLLPRYRTILVLKYLENMPVSAIAKKLTITFKSAESQLFRARKAFVENFTNL
ncbi:RNA polymerase sigma factor [Candidatus Gottesmanbacteria bacterium]|nr:RNA polymerase sigma factor [Candidatus Gottesmanbacteria bacterium]